MSTPEEDNVYNVEEIVGHRRNNGREEYLIKWEGYGEEENTWEPVSNLDEGTLKMAKAYKRQKGLKRKRRQVILDSDDEFISNVDDSYLSDGLYHEQSDDDGSRKETMPVTPSPPQRPRTCRAKTTERIRRSIQEKYGQGIVTQSRVARRQIFYDESDDSDTEGGNENNHQLPHLPLLPPSRRNLGLKITTMQYRSFVDLLPNNGTMGTHDLYCCPICYIQASRGRANWWVEDDDDDVNSDEEDKEDCFSFDDDPMTILGNVGSSVSSTFCFLKVKGVKMHLQDVHSVYLGDLKGNDLFKRFTIRSSDGLLQHYVGSHIGPDMQGYWQQDQNTTSFRNLLQLVKANEDKKPAANQSDFSKSFPNRARKIWEKVRGPYLKDDDSTEEEKFINDDIHGEDANEVRENPYFHRSSDDGEEVINQYLAGLKQRNEQNRGSESDASSPDDSNSNESSSLEDDDSKDDESNSEEDEDVNEDPWMKEKRRRKRRSILTNDDDSDDDSIFENVISQTTKCANFTASDDEE
jgi:hypothetical protein